MVRRATKRSHDGKKRREKKLIVVAAEGENKTELTYLKEFNRRQKEYRIIPAKGNNTDPENLVEDARKSAIRESLDYSFGDKAIAVFDTDVGKEQHIRKAVEKAKRENVEVYLSNPCFEVWLLLHFKYSTRSYYSSAEVVDELRNVWINYEKNMSSFECLEDCIKQAIENAERLEQYNREMHSKRDTVAFNPGTDIHKLIKQILPLD